MIEKEVLRKWREGDERRYTSAAIVRLEEINGVHFWLLKDEDQRQTHMFLFWSLGRRGVTWFVLP